MKVKNIFIGIGTNLGEKEKNLQEALKHIKKIAKILKKSKIHKTKPVGYKDQDDFLNMVIEIESELTPQELIIKLHEIEHKMGRIREIKNGPRIIDLDILLFDKVKVNGKYLKIPHPRMYEREFVLKPLAEIAPEKLKK
jgi:2-amino-4-hydroxy-6-hydroxymethyldihydropteridine diphosphokinase